MFKKTFESKGYWLKNRIEEVLPAFDKGSKTSGYLYQGLNPSGRLEKVARRTVRIDDTITIDGYSRSLKTGKTVLIVRKEKG